MVETFEAKGNKLKIKATSGKFEIRGRIPRQDHLVRVWQTRAWDSLPKEHLDWLVRPFSYITPHHPLSQYIVSETASITPSPVATETTQEMETTASNGGAGTVFVKPVIKNKCTNCGKNFNTEHRTWYLCPDCRSSYNKSYYLNRRKKQNMPPKRSVCESSNRQPWPMPSRAKCSRNGISTIRAWATRGSCG